MSLFFKKTIETCVLSTDFCKQEEEMDLWLKQRKVKGEIYRKYGELLSYMEASLNTFTNPVELKHIRRQIKTIQKMREKYDVPSVLTTRLDPSATEFFEGKVLRKQKREEYE